ncbi:hypothetical protein [Ornithinimicrobium kibberense]|uniref:hypothetical protein n=1 Tax=Ornithinimicrobium kibberense TaxID=282060 RepID=UPI003621109F
MRLRGRGPQPRVDAHEEQPDTAVGRQQVGDLGVPEALQLGAGEPSGHPTGTPTPAHAARRARVTSSPSPVPP